jgi:hypothetical protein
VKQPTLSTVTPKRNLRNKWLLPSHLTSATSNLQKFANDPPTFSNDLSASDFLRRKLLPHKRDALSSASEDENENENENEFELNNPRPREPKQPLGKKRNKRLKASGGNRGGKRPREAEEKM